jgi:hypothetical protein
LRREEGKMLRSEPLFVARRSWLEISLWKTGKGRKKEKGAYKKEKRSKQPSSTAEIRTQAPCRTGMSVGLPEHRWLLCLATLIASRQHARVPLFILGVGITEPPPTRRAMYGRRVSAGHIAT